MMPGVAEIHGTTLTSSVLFILLLLLLLLPQIKPEDLQYYELFQCPRLETWHCYRKVLEITARVGL